MTPFEAWQDPETGALFYFSHSDQSLTTGVMMLPPHSQLPKHHRPLAYENLIQIQGRCQITVFDEHDQPTEHRLEIGDVLRMEKGQYHIHANPSDEPSYTLFKAEGDIREVMQVLRTTFTRID